HFEEVGGRLFIKQLSSVDRLEQHHHFARSGNILAALLGGVQVHHFPTKPRVRESEGIEHGIDVVHANAVDEYICGRVVAHRNHHRGKVTKGDAVNAGCEPAYNVAV